MSPPATLPGLRSPRVPPCTVLNSLTRVLILATRHPRPYTRRHEAVDHVAVPLIVSLMVLAPVLAQLGVSEGCYRDRFFRSPEPVQTSVQVGYCTVLGHFTPSDCIAVDVNGQWLTYPAGATYTPPFRFDAERCISSIITVYTPE